MDDPTAEAAATPRRNRGGRPKSPPPAVPTRLFAIQIPVPLIDQMKELAQADQRTLKAWALRLFQQTCDLAEQFAPPARRR